MRWLTLILLALLTILMLGDGPGPARTRVAAAPGTAGRPERHRSGPQPFVTILCKFQDTPFEPNSRADVEQLFSARSGLDDYWREVSYGRINLEGSRVTGWHALPQPRSAYMVPTATGVDLQRLAHDCAAAADADVEFGDYVGINFAFSNNLTWRTWGGQVTLTLDGEGRRYATTWLWPQTLASQSTLAHEMGHALGLAHSSAGHDREYENRWDVMSDSHACSPGRVESPQAQHMIAYDKDLLGWIPPERKFTAPPDAISAIELARLALPGPEGYLMAVISITGSGTHFYTVEARRRAGYDGQLAGEAIVIHEVDTTRDPSARLVNRAGDGDTRVSASMWTPGMVFVDALNDVAVSVDGATATGYAITIFTGSRPWPRAPAEWSTLPEGDVTLAWQEAPGARRYEVSASCGGAWGEAWQMPRAVVRGAKLTVGLPKGDCEWRVRVLPGGEWSPPSHIRVGGPAGQWLPSEVVRALGPQVPGSLAIAARSPGEVDVAWTDPATGRAPAAIHVARRAGGAWEQTALSTSSQDLQIGAAPSLSLGPGGEVCAAWAYTLTPAPGAGSHGTGSNPDLWYACWSFGATGHAAPDHVTGETAPGGDPEGVMRINPGGRYAFPFLPEVVTDGAGNSYTVWEEFGLDGKADVYFAQRAAGGSWSGGARINDNGSRAPLWSPAIAVDAQGNASAVWRDGRNGGLDIYAGYRSVGGAWQANVRLTGVGTGNHEAPAVAVDGRGNAYAAWRSYCDCDGDGDLGSVQFSMRPAGGEWQSPITVAWDIGGRNVSGPAIAATTDGGVILVWEEQNDRTYTLYSAYRTVDGGWEPTVAIADSAGNAAPASPVLAADASGSFYLVWIEHRNGQAGLRLATMLPR